MPLPRPNPNAPRTTMLAERRKAEQKYRRSIERVLKHAERALTGVSDPAMIAQIMESLVNSAEFDAMCIEAARQMATMMAVGEKRTWRAAAAASSKGRKIYEALRRETAAGTPIGQAVSEMVYNNSKLIKTCPREMSQKLSALAQKRWTEGVRPEEIAKEVQSKAAHLREYEARRIARTESAKASTALVQARSEALGLDFYTWETCGDERVRMSHEKMDGVICRWSDPPCPESMAGEPSHGNYPPGGIYNCRCIALPVVELTDIKFPAKVHINGHIETIHSLKAFRERFGLNQPEEEN